MPAFGLADLLPQAAKPPGQGAVPIPGTEVVVDGGPGWEVDRQRPPHATVVIQVADRVHDVATRVRHRPTTAPRDGAPDRDVAGQDLPLGVAGVRRVPARTSRGQMG